MKVATIIFDIDGVLIDVSRSFRMVTAMVVADFLKEFEAYFGPPLFTPEATQTFKDRGGFNNDWELTEAAILICLYLKQKNQIFIPVRSLPSWYDGGGVEEIYQKCNFSLLDRDWIVRRFQIIYAGKSYCKRLYGFDAGCKSEGMIEQERVVLKKDSLSRDFQYGILTGRTKAETDLALEKIGLAPKFFESGVICEVKKPDPSFFDTLDFTKGIYIGDTVDDYEMVLNYQNAARTLSIIMIKPPFRKEIDRKLSDALLIVNDVNEALEWLHKKPRGEWT